MLALAMAPAAACNQVHSLEQATQALTEGEFKALIVDVNAATPEVLEVSIRDLSRIHPDVTKLAFASQITPDDPSSLLEMGFHTYVRAPFAEGAMLNALSNRGTSERTPRPVRGWKSGHAIS
jgi:DNA-binding NtrC family response regulator